MERKPLLRVQGIRKSFGGLLALDDVRFEIQQGEVFALIGPNGAGKSTLFNCISGINPPTNGSIDFQGQNLVSLPTWKRMEIGIARTFQNIELFSGMSVSYNIALGYHPKINYNTWGEFIFAPSVRKREKEVFKKVYDIAQLFGLEKYLYEQADNLPTGLQKLVELARASISAPKLLLLDEPAAGMTDHEVGLLKNGIGVIKQVNPEISILLIDHNMSFVMNFADRVGVLNFGRYIAEGTPKEIQNNKAVIDAYLGEGAHA